MDAAPPHALATQGRLRRLNLTMLLPAVAVGGVVVVATDAQTWWHALGLSVGVVAALVAFVAWTAGDLSRVAVPCLLAAAATWPFGVLVADSGKAVFGIAVVGSHVIPTLRSHRGAAAVGLAVFVAVVGAARLLVTQDDLRGDLLTYVLIPTGLTVVLTGLMFPNKRFYDVVADLERSRERDAELAVTRERVRFASDLHDIQGHTLHVVKLKVALAQQLVHTDPERAQGELREIYALVSDTITQTKELAHAQRRLNLSTELENAKNLFEAAGIHVRVVRERAAADAQQKELVGQVLRETTTNILRHSHASQVRITLSEQGIAILNDGVEQEVLPQLRGLSTLRHRVAEDGGELTVRLEDGWFLTAADFPEQGAESAPPTDRPTRAADA